ncbi:MAG: hypothetical protein ABF479_19955, partial [Gluconacetobacter sp.]
GLVGWCARAAGQAAPGMCPRTPERSGLDGRVPRSIADARRIATSAPIRSGFQKKPSFFSL